SSYRDWSSDVCSSDLEVARVLRPGGRYVVVTSIRQTTDAIGEVYEELSLALRGEQRHQDRTHVLERAGAAVGLRVATETPWEDRSEEGRGGKGGRRGL